MTTLLFRDDSYLRETEAIVVGTVTAGPDSKVSGVILDATNFYGQGGGQPGDSGVLFLSDGSELAVSNAVYGADRSAIVHVVGAEQRWPEPGDRVLARIDWDKRFARMRVHTALHLLTAVLPYPVTGGAIGDGEGRLDFDIPEGGLDKADIGDKLNALIETGADIRYSWISDDELLANPGLVKTMSVKPPMGTGRVRLVEIVGLDLQPCGGTHVANTREIGRVAITDIEKKGKQNRRVRMALI